MRPYQYFHSSNTGTRMLYASASGTSQKCTCSSKNTQGRRVPAGCSRSHAAMDGRTTSCEERHACTRAQTLTHSKQAARICLWRHVRASGPRAETRPATHMHTRHNTYNAHTLTYNQRTTHGPQTGLVSAEPTSAPSTSTLMTDTSPATSCTRPAKSWKVLQEAGKRVMWSPQFASASAEGGT
jgi:hypothetical protein